MVRAARTDTRGGQEELSCSCGGGAGKKMGKTASGAVWLKKDLLSEYDYWQFWRNTADADVIRFLKVRHPLTNRGGVGSGHG